MIILKIIAYIVGFAIGNSLFFYLLDKKEKSREKKENWQRKFLYPTAENIRGKRSEIDGN